MLPMRRLPCDAAGTRYGDRRYKSRPTKNPVMHNYELTGVAFRAAPIN
jgi:hypothetical protein